MHRLSDISRNTPAAGSGRGKRLALIFSSDAFHCPDRYASQVGGAGHLLRGRTETSPDEASHLPENRKATAADKKGPINGPTLQRS
jgi:hypothetical protein